MKKAILISLIFGVNACASHPDKIGASYVSPIKYADYNCRQIASEQETVNGRTIDLYNRLKKERNADNWQMGIGLIVLWPTLFFLEGGDGVEASEYSRLKGEYEALRQANVQKSCDINFMASTDELIKMEDERIEQAEEDAEKAQDLAVKTKKTAEKAKKDARRAASRAADAEDDAVEATNKAKEAAEEATEKGTRRAENRAKNAQEDAEDKALEANDEANKAEVADKLAKEAKQTADEAARAAEEAQAKLNI